MFINTHLQYSAGTISGYRETFHCFFWGTRGPFHHICNMRSFPLPRFDIVWLIKPTPKTCDPCMSMWEPCKTWRCHRFDFVNRACKTPFMKHAPGSPCGSLVIVPTTRKSPCHQKSTVLFGCELLGSSLPYRTMLKRKTQGAALVMLWFYTSLCL